MITRKAFRFEAVNGLSEAIVSPTWTLRGISCRGVHPWKTFLWSNGSEMRPWLISAPVMPMKR